MKQGVRNEEIQQYPTKEEEKPVRDSKDWKIK